MSLARESIRTIVSGFLCLFQLYMGLIYLFPPLVSRVNNPSPTVKIVQFIQSLGPYYTLGFAISGGVLLVALLTKRFIAAGHLLCFGVFFAYAMALLLGALSDTPHGPIIAPSLCVVPLVAHAVLALVYGGERT